jgi:Resolvase, N terminal domain
MSVCQSLAEPWADTTTSTGRLTIAVLGGLADVEKDLIRTRTSEGCEHAKLRGVRVGGKSKLTKEQRRGAGPLQGGGNADGYCALLQRQLCHDLPAQVLMRPATALWTFY